MKKTIFLVLIIGIIFISGCAKEKKITSAVEDLNNEQLFPGIYYEYNFDDEELRGIKDINAELILGNLVEKDIPLTEAWYESYASSCCPPDTNRCTQVIVEPVFLIKLAQETELENFIKVNEPELGICAYSITHYEIK